MPNPCPQSVRATLANALRQAGEPDGSLAAHPVGGGCINNACRLDGARRSYLFKWNAHAAPEMFQTEAHGLALLANAQALTVPEVYAVSQSGEELGFILMEWLAPAPSLTRSQLFAQLGEQLAALHRTTSPAFGLDHDNYIGTTPQLNGWFHDWVAFFRDRRLAPQRDLAQHNGLLPRNRAVRLEQLLGRLDTLLSAPAAPALLHGDLWAGNVIAGPRGPALIDPAAYFGHREAEIAYTELFGGFPPVFYDAYNATWPLDSGYDQRRELYNLYHLLNHLNLFGESYGAEIDAILRRYT